MLDAQRYKGNTLRREVHFARVVLWAHLGLGLLVVLLLLLHEVFSWAAIAAGWYCASVLLMTGLLAGQKTCRCGLALVFLAFALGGLFFLSQYLPALRPETPPLLPHSLLRLWLGGMNLAYAGGGLLLLRSESIRKAAEIGFRLW